MKKTLLYASLLASLALVGCKDQTTAQKPPTDPVAGSTTAPKESVGGDPTQP